MVALLFMHVPAQPREVRLLFAVKMKNQRLTGGNHMHMTSASAVTGVTQHALVALEPLADDLSLVLCHQKDNLCHSSPRSYHADSIKLVVFRP